MVIPFPVPVRRAVDSLADPLRLSAVTAMSPVLDDLSLKFAMWAGQADRTCLDVGCGAGVAAAAALARGGRVVAVDPDPVLIQQLLARVPVQQYARLSVRTAKLPELEFKAAGFAGVHVARVLHRLDGDAIQSSLAKFFRWLYPHGKLFVSVLTPLGGFWRRFQPEYSRRVSGGARWPGYIEDLAQLQLAHARRVSCHLLDEVTLERELQHAGFAIEAISCYSLPWDPEQICCGLIARCAP